MQMRHDIVSIFLDGKTFESATTHSMAHDAG
jgi:hypothetical protein